MTCRPQRFTAEPNDDGAGVEIADADRSTLGTSPAVSLSVGGNEITVTVTAEDGIATKIYTVTLTRAEPSVAWGERLPDRDIVLESDAIPTGLWADNTNAWVIAHCYAGEVNAYALSEGSETGRVEHHPGRLGRLCHGGMVE